MKHAHRRLIANHKEPRPREPLPDKALLIRLIGKQLMGKILSHHAISSYEENGVYSPISVLTETEVLHYRSKLAEQSRRGPLRGALMFKTHLMFRWVDELIRHPRILDAVEDILGPNLLAWNSHWFIKEPNDGRYVSWHQDTTYWNLTPGDAVTVWLALSPATVESGAMRMIPGTHTRDVVPHTETWKEGSMLTRGQEIAVKVNEAEAIDVVLQPGEMSLHHPKIFHASHTNQSNDLRIGLAIRYIPTYVRQTAISDDSAALVRGIDKFYHFREERRPTLDYDPIGAELQKRASDAQRRILYAGTDRQEFRKDL